MRTRHAYRIVLFFSMTLTWLVAGSALAQNNPSDVNCSPANLLLVVDTSGSMSSAGKLDGLKKAASDVVNQFKKKLRMGIIRFSAGKAELLVPIGPAHAKTPDVEGHAKKLLDAITNLKATGDTPMTQAMELALSTYQKEIPTDPLHQDPDPNTKRRNFVLLVTDGEPTDETAGYNPLQFIKKLRSVQIGSKTYDILTFVVGLGTDNDIRTFELQQFAKQGGTDNFLQALKPADLAPFFSTIATKAGTETCNGRDDDCDGSVDEDLERKCTGACGEGKEICQKGKWSKCDAPPPGQEICDGRDNNCNGSVDEGLSRPCSSRCGDGTQSCIQGDWSTCTAPRPEAEICDNKDNDCDGQIDNGSPCPGGKCVIKGGTAVCEIKCKGNECPQGYVCDSATQNCNELPCNRKKCLAGSVCINQGNTAICKDPCEGVSCESGKTCGEKGTCINCYESKCAQGKTCREGVCQIDKCFDLACPEGQGCREGKCFDSCKGVQCAAGETCTKGRCEKDKCTGITCTASQVCDSQTGQCVDNRCITKFATVCRPGQVCDPQNGACTDDPCSYTECPQGETCYMGECGVTEPTPTGQPGSYCKEDKDCGGGNFVCKNRYCIEVQTQGGVGCGCSTQGQQGWQAPVLMLLVFWGFLLLLRIRRTPNA